MIHQFVFAEAKEKSKAKEESTWVEIDIITGIIQNTATKEKYTLGESPRTYRAPGPLPKFYRWCRTKGNSGGGAGPSDYSLCLTEDGQSRQWLVVQLVNLDPKRWPTVDVLKNISVEELQAMYEGHPFNHSLQREIVQELEEELEEPGPLAKSTR